MFYFSFPSSSTTCSLKRLHWKKPPVLASCNDQACIQIQQNSCLHFRQVIWLHPSFFSIGVEHFGHRLVFAEIHIASASVSASTFDSPTLADSSCTNCVLPIEEQCYQVAYEPHHAKTYHSFHNAQLHGACACSSQLPQNA